MHVKKGCKDCGFYDDCPTDYQCPALEALDEIMKREGMYFTVIDGNIIELVNIDLESEEE